MKDIEETIVDLAFQKKKLEKILDKTKFVIFILVEIIEIKLYFIFLVRLYRIYVFTEDS